MSISLLPFFFDINQGFSYSPADNINRQQPLHGTPLNMASYIDAKRRVNGGFAFNRVEHNEFWVWFYDTINSGADEFITQIDVDGSLQYKKARFVRGSVGSSGGGPNFTVAAALVVSNESLTVIEILSAIGAKDAWSVESTELVSGITDYDIPIASGTLDITAGSQYAVDFGGSFLGRTFSSVTDSSYGMIDDCCVGIFFRSETAGVGSSTEFSSLLGGTAGDDWEIKPYGQSTELTQWNDKVASPISMSFGKLTELGDELEHLLIYNRTVTAGVVDVDLYIDNVFIGTQTSTGTLTAPAIADGVKLIINSLSQVGVPFLFDRKMTEAERDIVYQVAVI